MTDDPNAEDSLEGQPELPENEELADEEVVESAPAVEPDEDTVEDDRAEASGRKPAQSPAQRRRVAGAAMPAGVAARSRTRGIVIDPALRIRDRVSEAFVIGTVLVFALIFANALAFGHGGAFSPTPTPLPSVVATLGPGESAAPTIAPIPTEFQVPPSSSSPGPSESVAPSAS